MTAANSLQLWINDEVRETENGRGLGRPLLLLFLLLKEAALRIGKTTEALIASLQTQAT